jgi:hypothetical protein
MLLTSAMTCLDSKGWALSTWSRFTWTGGFGVGGVDWTLIMDGLASRLQGG